jgi:hypothetical protein
MHILIREPADGPPELRDYSTKNNLVQSEGLCCKRASFVLLGAFMPFVWRNRSPRLGGLSAVIFLVIVANAFVTGILSNVEDRYQSRVIWLLRVRAVSVRTGGA